jgi:hypothetical protein
LEDNIADSKVDEREARASVSTASGSGYEVNRLHAADIMQAIIGRFDAEHPSLWEQGELTLFSQEMKNN